MIKISDSIALGAFCGIVATIPQLIFDYLSFILGYSHYFAFQISGSIYLHKNSTTTIPGLILGGLTWESQAMFLGILTVYLIRLTGIDYW